LLFIRPSLEPSSQTPGRRTVKDLTPERKPLLCGQGRLQAGFFMGTIETARDNFSQAFFSHGENLIQNAKTIFLRLYHPIFPCLPSRRLSENPHLPFDRLTALSKAEGRRCTHPSSLRRTFMYASFLRISRALHLHIFQQPLKFQYSDRLLAQHLYNIHALQ